MASQNMPDNLQAARIRCSQDRPYLTSLLLRLSPVATPGLGTLGVDKYARLYFDPALDWTVPALATVLYHEVSHLLRDHAGRGEAQGITPQTPENAQAWNVAGDCEINDDIEAEGGAVWPFPPCLPGKLNPKQKDGLFAEDYFASFPPPPSQPQSGGQSGKGQGQGQGEGKGQPAPGVGAGKCGGAAGNPQPHEQGAPSNAGGAKDAAPGISPAEMDAVKHKVASDIREHVKNRGNVPGHLQSWATALLEPKVNWRKLLRANIRRCMADVAGMTDYSYSRPSRRQLPRVVLPSMRQPVPKIAVVIDTSGSMSENDLEKVLAEVNGVLKQCGQKDGVDAIVCDAQVHSAGKIFRASQITLAGRGGTDMRRGIQAALDRRERPHAIIVLTDGETPWPDSAPSGVSVIAAIVGQDRNLSVPGWIRVVMVDSE